MLHNILKGPGKPFLLVVYTNKKMDTLIELLQGINVVVIFALSECIGEYIHEDLDFVHIIVDPTSEYDAELILKHEFVHALQHECARNDVLPFPKHVWNNIKPPAYYVQQAVKEYRTRYQDKPLDLCEIQAMALETMPVNVLVEIYKYITK